MKWDIDGSTSDVSRLEVRATPAKPDGDENGDGPTKARRLDATSSRCHEASTTEASMLFSSTACATGDARHGAEGPVDAAHEAQDAAESANGGVEDELDGGPAKPGTDGACGHTPSKPSSAVSMAAAQPAAECATAAVAQRPQNIEAVATGSEIKCEDAASGAAAPDNVNFCEILRGMQAATTLQGQTQSSEAQKMSIRRAAAKMTVETI